MEQRGHEKIGEAGDGEAYVLSTKIPRMGGAVGLGSCMTCKRINLSCCLGKRQRWIGKGEGSVLDDSVFWLGKLKRL